MSSCKISSTLILFIFFIPYALLAQKGYYIPKSLILPLHDKSQQLHASLGSGGGYDLHLSYSFTNHFALFSTGTLHKGTVKRTTLFSRYNIKKDDYAIKAGLGYFTKTSMLFNIIETYLGVGMYKVDNYWYFVEYHPEDIEITKAQFWNVYWQINAAISEEKGEIAYALRLAYSAYPYFEFYRTQPNSNSISSYENVWGLTVDPVASYSYKWNSFKLNLQTGVSWPLYRAEARRTITYPDKNIKAENEREKVDLTSFLARISLQYTFNLNSKNR